MHPLKQTELEYTDWTSRERSKRSELGPERVAERTGVG